MKIRVRPCKRDFVLNYSLIFPNNTFYPEVLENGVEIIKTPSGYEFVKQYKSHVGNIYTLSLRDQDLKDNKYFYLSKD